MAAKRAATDRKKAAAVISAPPPASQCHRADRRPPKTELAEEAKCGVTRDVGFLAPSEIAPPNCPKLDPVYLSDKRKTIDSLPKKVEFCGS